MNTMADHDQGRLRKDSKANESAVTIDEQTASQEQWMAMA